MCKQTRTISILLLAGMIAPWASAETEVSITTNSNSIIDMGFVVDMSKQDERKLATALATLSDYIERVNKDLADNVVDDSNAVLESASVGGKNPILRVGWDPGGFGSSADYGCVKIQMNNSAASGLSPETANKIVCLEPLNQKTITANIDGSAQSSVTYDFSKVGAYTNLISTGASSASDMEDGERVDRCALIFGPGTTCDYLGSLSFSSS